MKQHESMEGVDEGWIPLTANDRGRSGLLRADSG